MKMARPCPRCDCTDPQGADAHEIVEALARDDLDDAISLGLLGDVSCMHCAPACAAGLRDARDARRRALAARERYRVRQARLQRRAALALAKRMPAQAAATAPSLPSAAAAALARAKARASGQEPE